MLAHFIFFAKVNKDAIFRNISLFFCLPCSNSYPQFYSVWFLSQSSADEKLVEVKVAETKCLAYKTNYALIMGMHQKVNTVLCFYVLCLKILVIIKVVFIQWSWELLSLTVNIIFQMPFLIGTQTLHVDAFMIYMHPTHTFQTRVLHLNCCSYSRYNLATSSISILFVNSITICQFL